MAAEMLDLVAASSLHNSQHFSFMVSEPAVKIIIFKDFRFSM
jgi:hypothetical protein